MLRSRPYRVSCSRIGHIDVPSTMFRAPPPESVEIVESEAAPSVPREPRDDAMLARMPAISAVPFTRVHLSRAFWAERLVPNPHEHHPHGAREVRRAGRRRALRQRPRRDRGRHRLPVGWRGAGDAAGAGRSARARAVAARSRLGARRGRAERVWRDGDLVVLGAADAGASSPTRTSRPIAGACPLVRPPLVCARRLRSERGRDVVLEGEATALSIDAGGRVVASIEWEVA